MQRDLKVGLSLGVLVLGVVGALLFRREPNVVPRKPVLQTAKKLDERIAERPSTPYMGDIEFDQDDAPAAPSNGSTEGLSDNDRPAHTVPPKWLEEDDPFQVARNPNGHSDLARDLRATNTDAIPVAPRAVSPHRTPETAHTALQTHVIQSGESLSTIAEHYLGSQGRFQEIYEANRDVLTDPNRLPLGTTIVIPAKNKVARKAQAPATSPFAPKSLAGHPEKVRGTITDVSAIEPITPAGDGIATEREAQPDKAADQVAAPTPVVPTQTRDARKLFSPSRLPFSNNRSQPTNRTRKPIDPEGEGFIAPTVTPTTDGAPTATADARVYQVRKGDSLEKISQKAYGNPKRASDIFAANRELLASPDAVREGQELVLPN